MKKFEFTQVAIVKAGPHELPWIQSGNSLMDEEMPEGQLVLVKIKQPELSQLVICNTEDYRVWWVPTSSLIFLGEL